MCAVAYVAALGAGAAAAVRSGLRSIRPGGRYVQVGLLSGDISIPFGLVVTKEIGVRAGFGSSPTAWWRATDLVASHSVDLPPLVSTVLPLGSWAVALERLERRQGLKSVLDPRLEG